MNAPGATRTGQEFDCSERKADRTMTAVRRYVPPDPGAALDWPVRKRGNVFLGSLAEMFAQATGKTYRSLPSPFGPGLLLEGISQIDEVVGRFSNGLSELRIVADRKLEPLDLSRVSSMSALRSLSLGNAQRVSQASEIEKLVNLAKLEMEEVPDQNVDLAKLDRLKWLHVTASPRWRNMAQLDHLQFLQLSTFRDADFRLYGLPREVKRLELYGSSTLQALDGISAIRELRYLALSGLSKLSTLDSIGPLKDLTHLIVENARSLVNIDAAAKLPALTYLEIRNCPNLKNVPAFPATGVLTHVFFTGSTRLTTPIDTVIDRLPHLKYFFAAE